MTENKQPLTALTFDTFEEVINEVNLILEMISPEIEVSVISKAFDLIVDLFQGKWKVYKACSTQYHDLDHVLSTFLAMARLVHGAVLNGYEISPRLVEISLMAALLHDAGYIQNKNDNEGTGAKFTMFHVQRSMDFLQIHHARFGLTEDEAAIGVEMIRCTDLAVDFTEIEFASKEIELLGKTLGASDLLAQMADRAYLEKLLFLYHEFKEANAGGYSGELDLLQKTIGFFEIIEQRLDNLLDSADKIISAHFATRWDYPANLYFEAIERQKEYLARILADQESDPRNQLKRGGIVALVRQQYG